MKSKTKPVSRLHLGDLYTTFIPTPPPPSSSATRHKLESIPESNGNTSCPTLQLPLKIALIPSSFIRISRTDVDLHLNQQSWPSDSPPSARWRRCECNTNPPSAAENHDVNANPAQPRSRAAKGPASAALVAFQTPVSRQMA